MSEVGILSNLGLNWVTYGINDNNFFILITAGMNEGPDNRE